MTFQRGTYKRYSTALTVTFASGSVTSNAFDMGDYALGLVILPSAFTGMALGAYVATAGGAFIPLPDRSNAWGVDVSCNVPTAALTTAHACPIPPYWFGADQIKLFSHDSSGSGIQQTGAKTATVLLKV